MDKLLKVLKILFRFHNYYPYKEFDLKDNRGEIVGKCIISRCSDCGKLKKINVITRLDN